MGSSLTAGRDGDDLPPRGAPLEYWFLRVGTSELAFLVDWIIRRKEAAATVRVSLWVHGEGRVLHEGSGSWRDTAAEVVIAGCVLTSHRASGQVADVTWDLTYSPGPWLLDPAPALAKVLRPFDLQLIARPRARFTGTVVVGGESFRFDDTGGTFSHYWGRRLPDSWVWVSAGGLGDDGDACVEAALFRSRLWGMPGPLATAGYLALDAGRRTAQVVAPAYGRITTRGTESAFELSARSLTQSLHLTARAGRDSYNDLGEGIHQVLVADLSVDGVGSCEGRAGLEIRGHLLDTPWTSTS